jgi:hypothetical protein
MPSLPKRQKRAIAIIVAIAIPYYAFILSNGSLRLVIRPNPSEEWSLGLVFNSMLFHILHGEFDVDFRSVGQEAFIREGKAYSYFGILPALLRVALVPFVDLAYDDPTRLSCLLAVLLALLCKLAAFCTVYRYAIGDIRSALPFWPPLLILAFSGAQIMFLRPSFYEEPILWAGALSAAFTAYTLRGLLSDRIRDAKYLSVLALLAGGCMLTRVSTAMGTCAALVLLLGWNTYVDAKAHRLHSSDPAGYMDFFGDWMRAVRRRRFWQPALILLLLLAAAGFVNYHRFGNPLTFIDIRLQTLFSVVDERIRKIDDYGNYSLLRIGFGLMYYLFPVWFIRSDDGTTVFSQFATKAVDLLELPPSSFLLTDPLLLLGGMIGLATIVRRGRLSNDMRLGIAALAAGLLLPALLMLGAISYSFRYRMEFYPLFEMCFFVAYLVPWRGGVQRGVLGGGMLAWSLCLGSIAMAHAFLLFNRLSPRGWLYPGFSFYEVYVKRVLDAVGLGGP